MRNPPLTKEKKEEVVFYPKFRERIIILEPEILSSNNQSPKLGQQQKKAILMSVSILLVLSFLFLFAQSSSIQTHPKFWKTIETEGTIEILSKDSTWKPFTEETNLAELSGIRTEEKSMVTFQTNPSSWLKLKPLSELNFTTQDSTLNHVLAKGVVLGFLLKDSQENFSVSCQNGLVKFIEFPAQFQLTCNEDGYPNLSLLQGKANVSWKTGWQREQITIPSYHHFSAHSDSEKHTLSPLTQKEWFTVRDVYFLPGQITKENLELPENSALKSWISEIDYDKNAYIRPTWNENHTGLHIHYDVYGEKNSTWFSLKLNRFNLESFRNLSFQLRSPEDTPVTIVRFQLISESRVIKTFKLDSNDQIYQFKDFPIRMDTDTPIDALKFIIHSFDNPEKPANEFSINHLKLDLPHSSENLPIAPTENNVEVSSSTSQKKTEPLPQAAAIDIPQSLPTDELDALVEKLQNLNQLLQQVETKNHLQGSPNDASSQPAA